jgi:hypothetical protein
MRSEQPISELLLWDYTKVVNYKCAKAASNANYSRPLLKLKAIGKVDRLVNNNVEAGKLMLDREAWRSRHCMIVKAKKSNNSERCRTRSAIVV